MAIHGNFMFIINIDRNLSTFENWVKKQEKKFKGYIISSWFLRYSDIEPVNHNPFAYDEHYSRQQGQQVMQCCTQGSKENERDY